MKPMLIFQLTEDIEDEAKNFLHDIIMKGIDNGHLILDSRVCVLSFDKNGDMNYCTPKYAIKTE